MPSVKTLLRKYLSYYLPDALAAFRAGRRAWNARRHIARETRYGFKFASLVDTFQVSDYEPQEIIFIKKELEQADILVDVGANVGLYTCLALSLNKYVVAIEPLAWNLSYLYSNLQANGWSNLEVYPMAVGKSIGIAQMFGSGMSASLIDGWAARFNAVENSKPEMQSTPVSTLDTLIGTRFQGKRLVVKMDVEGAEYDALLGAQSLLTTLPHPVWMIEIFSADHSPGGFNPHFKQTFELFWQHDYIAQDMDGNIIQPSDVEAWTTNRALLANSNYVFRQP